MFNIGHKHLTIYILSILSGAEMSSSGQNTGKRLINSPTNSLLFCSGFTQYVTNRVSCLPTSSSDNSVVSCLPISSSDNSVVSCLPISSSDNSVVAEVCSAVSLGQITLLLKGQCHEICV